MTNETAFKTRWPVDKIAVTILVVSIAVRIGYLLMVLNQTSIQFLAENPFDTKRYMAITDAICNLTISGNFDIYWLGFGYGLFLAVLLSVSGKSLIFVLLFQILLSSISSVLIYKIGYMITRLRTLAVLAAAVHVFSLTSVALSTSFLSETVFFVCLLLLIYLFIRMNENPTPGKYIASALLVTYAAFVRSVGQFLPFVIIAAVILTPRSCFTIAKRKLVKYTVISMAGALCLLMAWSFRNYAENKTFVVAGNGTGTAGWYLGTRVACNRSDSQTVQDFRNIFDQELHALNNRPPTPRERHDWYVQKLWSQFTENPVSFAKSYFLIVWENINFFDLISSGQLPKYAEALKAYRLALERYKIPPVIICLSVLGFFFLLAHGSRAPSILLGLFYFYFVTISGVTYWQGSRIFFPAQASYAIFLASVVFFPLKYACHIMAKVNWTKLTSGIRKIGRRIAVIMPYPKRLLKLPTSDNYIRTVAIIAVILTLATTSAIWIFRPPDNTAVDLPAIHAFDDRIELIQIRFEEKDGSTSAIRFEFKPLSEINEDYKIFLHLFPQTGGEMLNRDFRPNPPTSRWQPGIVTIQRRPVRLEPGIYRAEVGFYRGVKRLGNFYTFMMTVK